MTPDKLVNTVSPKFQALGGAFYFHPDTLARGKELGLDGFRFYVLGRGGVLGDVESRVVTSAFGYFNAPLVDKLWNSAKAKVEPRQAAREYLACGHALARTKLADTAGLDAFCAAAEAVVAAADPGALALFAGISAEPLPDDAPARAYQLTSVLREHRGSAHLAAVRAVGLSPKVAHTIKRPTDVANFGYGPEEVPEITDEDRARHARAEEITNLIEAPAYGVLDDAGATALAAGVDGIEAAFA
ncbi:MAG: hypothetical protein GEV08_11155 [Acidimicrobiia bacterium]|nr:hypothetical protein [Acidimicrobiia bacterium]